MKRSPRAGLFLARSLPMLGAAATLSGGCAKTAGTEGTVAITVKLGTNFAESQVTGLKLIIDAPGDAGASLGLSASAAKSYSVGGRNYTTEVTNCDNDNASEFCITFNENPFSASTFKFKLTGAWPESTAFAIRCVVVMQNAREESALRESLDDGTPIRFVSGQTRDVTCDVPCRTGYSCEGTQDTTPPVAPIGTGVVPQGPANNNAPVVSGTAEANTTIRIYVGDTTCTATPTTGTVNDAGQFAVVVPVSDNSTTVFYGRVVDGAGNVSGTCPALNAIPYIEDSTAPATPTAPDLDPASDMGASSTDNITNDTTPTLSGSAEGFAMVSLYHDGGTLVGTASTGANGAYSVTSSALGAGDYAFTVKATDDAGNVSGASAALSVTIDTTAPATPAAPDLGVCCA